MCQMIRLLPELPDSDSVWVTWFKLGLNHMTEIFLGYMIPILSVFCNFDLTLVRLLNDSDSVWVRRFSFCLIHLIWSHINYGNHILCWVAWKRFRPNNTTDISNQNQMIQILLPESHDTDSILSKPHESDSKSSDSDSTQVKWFIICLCHMKGSN